MRKVKRRLHNPGKRLSLKQRLHFGTARQRASAKAALSGHRKRNSSAKRKTKIRRAKAVARKSNAGYGASGSWNATKTRFTVGVKRKKKSTAKRKKNGGVTLSTSSLTKLLSGRKVTKRRKATTKRRKNVGEIMLVSPALGLNPGRKRKTMAKKRKSISRRRRSAKRNPGTLNSGTMGKVAGFGAGFLGTRIVSSMLPASLQTGAMGVLATGAVAWGVSVAAKKTMGNAFGASAMFGGQVITVMKALQTFAPGIAASLPGMGLLAPTNALWPNPNINGSLTQFQNNGVAQTVNEMLASRPMPQPSRALNGLPGTVRGFLR